MICIPLDSSSKDPSALYCDLGKVEIVSAVQRKNPSINYKEEKDPAKLYDYYELRLEKVQIYRKDSDRQANLKNEQLFKYIRDLTMTARLYNCLDRGHPTAPVIKLGGIMNRLDIVLTDKNITYLLNILENMQKDQFKIQKKIAKETREKLKSRMSLVVGQDDTKLLKDITASVYAPKIEEKKKEEKKKEEKVTIIDGTSFAKKTKEIMLHFDDINIEIGRTITKDPGFKPYASYEESMRKLHPDEVPYIVDMRFGINGFSAYGYLTKGGDVKLDTHLFRIYIRDMQQYAKAVRLDPAKPSELVVSKLVSPDFELIFCNPSVEKLKEHRIDDNYKAFEENPQFFSALEQGKYFKEEVHQIDINLEGNLVARKIELQLILNSMVITFPYHSLRPINYLLAVVNASMPPPLVPAPVAIKKTKALAIPKKEFTFSFKGVLKQIELNLPINVRKHTS